jgi:uncharacterized protein
MSGVLPELIDPLRCVDSGAELAGSLPLSALPRLRAELADVGGDLAYRLRFSRDEERRAIVTGEVRARLHLVCQRCLQPLEQGVETSFALAPIQSLDEASRLPDRYEPLLLSAAMVRPAELLEDELLLSLPQIPMHRPGECRAEEASSDGEPRGGSCEAPHPFAALAGWERRSGG